MIHKIELQKFTRGGIAFNKSYTDFSKRFGNMETPGYKMLLKGDLKDPGVGFYKTFNEGLMEDFFTSSLVYDEIGESITATLQQQGDPEAENIGNLYKGGQSNKSDAFGVVSIDFYKAFKEGKGEWEIEDEQAFQNYKKGRPGNKFFRDNSGRYRRVEPIKTYFDAMIEKNGMYSHIMKEEWVLEYLESDNFPNTELVMWCDAGDVIFIDNPQRIIDVFYEYDCDLLYSTTTFFHGDKGGYHDDFMEDAARWQNELKPNLYLNAGVVIGRPDFAKEVLRAMLELKWDKRFTQHPPEAPEHMKMADDQEVLRYLHPKFYPRMKIDNEDDRKLAWRH